MKNPTTPLYVLRRQQLPEGQAAPAELVRDARLALRFWSAPAGRHAVILMETPDQVLATLLWAPHDEVSALVELGLQCETCRIAWSTSSTTAGDTSVHDRTNTAVHADLR